MRPFGMTGVPPRGVNFGHLEEASSKPTQAPSVDIGQIKKGPLVSISVTRAVMHTGQNSRKGLVRTPGGEYSLHSDRAQATCGGTPHPSSNWRLVERHAHPVTDQPHKLEPLHVLSRVTAATSV